MHRRLGPPRISKTLILLSAVVLLAMTALLAGQYAQHFAQASLLKRSAQSLDVYADELAREIDKYAALPAVIAQHPVFQNYLTEPDNPLWLDRVNRHLELVNDLSRAMDTYLINTEGLVVASSNWQSENSFMGEDLSFRPYFTQALQDGSASYFALGTSSRKRGYYFASLIESENEPVGVLIVKIDMTALEESWSDDAQIIIVTDEDGVIFLSTHQQWLYKSLQPLNKADLLRIESSLQYADITVSPLPISERRRMANNTMLTFSDTDGNQTSYFQYSMSTPQKDWHIHILSDCSEMIAPVRTFVMTICSLVLMLMMVGFLIYTKKQNKKHRDALEKQAYELLEKTVDDRTRLLREEIRERQQAESQLREAQNNLVQAAKMAAVGQMSTSITHELNQPLGAIRNFADNALVYLSRGNHETASSNLVRICSMTDRMNGIMQHLKLFARKTPMALESVSIVDVLNDTLVIMERAMREAEVTLLQHDLDRRVKVKAEPVRLQQVFTNLLQNAIDSMCNSQHRVIEISMTQQQDRIQLIVTDSGSGIDDELRKHLFEPFVTTKTGGDGLGLGLAITHQIIQQFGGEITVDTSRAGGARFCLTLVSAGRVAEEVAA